MDDLKARELRIEVPGKGEVTGLLLRPPQANGLVVLAHGAGTDMRHASMERIAAALGSSGLATLRYQFPYTEKRRGAPDRPPVLVATVRAAVAAAARAAPGLLLLAGGKSMGGRMTSTAAAETPLPGVAGLVFFGFPLHPAGQPGTQRGEHLAQVSAPMLFLQGTRDTLADLALLRPVVEQLGSRATLHVVEGADHSFHVLKRSGRTDEQVMAELAAKAASWAAGLA